MRKFITALIFISFFFAPYLAYSQTTADEKFDGVTAPAFPAGWSVDVPIIGGKWTWNTTVGPYNPTTPGAPSTPNVATFQSYNLASGATARLITPTLNWTSVTTPTFSFKFRRDPAYMTSIDRVYIDVSTDNGTSWTEIAGPYNRPTDIPGTTYWQDISVNVAGYAGQASVKFAFRAVSAYGNWMHIDNLFIGQPITDDVGTTAILSPTGTVGGASSFSVSANVKNFGQNTETFNVTAEIGAFSTVATVSSLAANTQTTVNFPDQWTPPDSGTYTVKVYTQLAGDENAANDTLTTTTRVLTHDAGVTAIVTPPPGGKVSGRPQTVKAKVKNFGTNTEDFNLKAEIGSFSSTALVSSLTPGAEVEVTLPDTWTPDTAGTYSMIFYTQLLTDQKATNDTLKGTVKVWKANYDILVCVSANPLMVKDSSAYAVALQALGKGYDMWKRWGTAGNEELPPDLYQWKTIIFGPSTGTGWSLNDAQIDSITAWLNSGTPENQKNLFLGADDVGYGLTRFGATAKDSAFYFQYLRAEYETELNSRTWIYGVPGECVSRGSDSINISLFYPDVVRPNSSYPGAEPVLLFNQSVTTDSANMLKYDGTNFNVMYLANRFYALDDPANPAPASSEVRKSVLGRALSWFDSPTCRDVGALAVVAPSGVSGKKPLDMTGRVKNFGLDPETFDLIIEVGAWSDTESVADLAAGAETLITCSSQWTPPANGDYAIKAYTQMAGDQNAVNDSAFGSVSIFTYGDADGNGTLQVGDVVYVINYLFKSGPAPSPLLSGDVNCDGEVKVSDAIYTINHLFKSGPGPCQFYAKVAAPAKK